MATGIATTAAISTAPSTNANNLRPRCGVGTSDPEGQARIRAGPATAPIRARPTGVAAADPRQEARPGPRRVPTRVCRPPTVAGPNRVAGLDQPHGGGGTEGAS